MAQPLHAFDDYADGAEIPAATALDVRAVDAVEHGKVIYLTDAHRHRVAAIVPAEIAAAGLAAVTAIEDAALITAARQALAEPYDTIPLEQVLNEIGYPAP